MCTSPRVPPLESRMGNGNCAFGWLSRPIPVSRAAPRFFLETTVYDSREGTRKVKSVAPWVQCFCGETVCGDLRATR